MAYDFLNQLGYGNLLNSAKSNISNQLNGMPSVSATRQSNAYFGADSGMPSSDFVRNRGYDLYGQKAEAQRQTGLGNLNNLISTTASPELTNQGQQMQNTQFGANLGQQNSQFSQDLELRKFLAQLQAIGLGQSITSSGQKAPTL